MSTNPVQTLCRLALGLIGIPLGAYWLAKLVFGDANLVGPFLFVSPLFAISIVAYVVSLFWRGARERDDSRADPALQTAADRFCQQLGIRPLKVVFYPDDGQEAFVPVLVTRDEIRILETIWSHLTASQREFGLAQALASKALGRFPWKGVTLGVTLIEFAGCFAASQNLWLIIPMHVCLFASYVFLPWLLMRWTTLLADKRAIDLTHNLDAAVKYILNCNHAWHPGLSLETRIAALRAHARAQWRL